METKNLNDTSYFPFANLPPSLPFLDANTVVRYDDSACALLLWYFYIARL